MIKFLNDKKGLSIKNRIASKLILPVILSGMVTSSLSGCSKNSESKAEPTKVEVNQDLIDAIESGKEFNLNEDGSITYLDDNYNKVLTVDDLKKCGMKFELVQDGTELFGDVLVYEINNIDLKKLPKNVLFEGIEKSIEKVDNIELDTNVTWDDCIEEINKKDIEDKFKKILVNTVEKYKTLGLEKGLPIFYSNIKNSKFVKDLTHPSAMFKPYDHELIIGNADAKEDKESLSTLRMLVDCGYMTEEEYQLLLTQEDYILTHEPGHMISMYYDEKTGKLVDISNFYVVVEKETNKIINMFELGHFLGEGFADYLTHESINRKPTRMYGYSINQSFYLSCKEMFGLNSLEELRTFDTRKLINKLKEIGFSSPFDWVMVLEQIVNSDLNMLYSPSEDNMNSMDLTDIIEALFQDYYNAQINNGVSKEEIEEVFDKIIKNIRERIEITNMDGSLVVEGEFGYTTLCTTCLENYAKQIMNQKVYIK